MGDYDRQQNHRFGARHRGVSRMSASDRESHGRGPHYHTAAFERVAESTRPNDRHYRNWGDDSNTFDFGREQNDDYRREERPREEVVTNREPKYIRPTGKRVATPGSSLMQASNPTTDPVLGRGFAPPREQDAFLTKITKLKVKPTQSTTAKNTALNRGKKRSEVLSSLETASGPPPKRPDTSKAPTGSSGWVPRPVPGQPKPRMLLSATTKRKASPEKRRRLEEAAPKRKYHLRERVPSGFEAKLAAASPFEPPGFTLRSSSRSKRVEQTDTKGTSALEPIALDSDSDSEPEEQLDNGSQTETIDTTKEADDSNELQAGDQEGKETPAAESEDFQALSVAKIDGCDVMIGLFQCVVSLLFQNDRMRISNIRGKYEKWPLKDSYVLGYDKFKDVRLYEVPKESEVDVEMGEKEPEKMEQLLDEASFLVFKCPLPEEADCVAFESFYDPTREDLQRAYMMLRPLEDATGDTDLDEIKDILRGHTDVEPIDKDQAKEYLQTLGKEPFRYNAKGRSKRRKSTDESEESPSSSDEEDSSYDVVVLTYPLPPCTSDIVTIIRRDVLRLKPRRYLNDNIIDYYFKRMMLRDYQDNEIVQDKVLFLSSHFYSRLRAGKGGSPGARIAAGYKNISTWLTRSRFFDRSIIFIPINKDLHWSLAIILNPRLAASQNNEDDEAFSCIAVLDPLGSYHRKAAIVRNLRMFLRLEWENYKSRLGDEESQDLPLYELEEVVSLRVKTPKQENSYDCGVYVLKFAEVILHRCVELELLQQNKGVIARDVTDEQLAQLISPTAFSPGDISVKRKEIEKYIQDDSDEYQRLMEHKQQQKAAKKASKASSNS